MVFIRGFRSGDDLLLNDILHDAADPAQHMARSLFREDSDATPVSRTVVAGVDDSTVLLGAATLTESPAHPDRVWLHVEVAQSERESGVGTALLAAVRAAAAGTVLDGKPERVRVSAGSVGETVARGAGFTELFRTRVVRVSAMALGGLGADRLEDLHLTATGSVALTQAYSDWYQGVNRADPAAQMSLGEFNKRFLSEATGAHGAALFKRNGRVNAFAVSYPAAQDAPAHAGGGADQGSQGTPAGGHLGEGEHGDGLATELTLGAPLEALPEVPPVESAEFQAALGDTGALLARLSTDSDVVIEVTNEMPVVTVLMDGLLSAGKATVLYEYVTLGN